MKYKITAHLDFTEDVLELDDDGCFAYVDNKGRRRIVYAWEGE